MFTPDDILYEDNHLMVVNKHCGDLVQPDRETDDALETEIKAMITACEKNAIRAQEEGVLDVSESLHAIDRLNKRIRHGVVMLDLYASTSSYQLGADPIDLDELK